jgi:type II secretory pathway predicted ATPase ExeA
MNDKHLQHFRLQVDPFSKSIDDKDLWMPPSKVDIVDSLVDTVHLRRSALLVGDPGVGKTCVLRSLRHRLRADGVRLTYANNTTLGRRDFYRQICMALNLAPKATAASVFFTISTHIAELGRDKMHSVFIIDEAHLLHQDVLDHLHILANFEWDSEPLLSILLIGLPELEERLALRRNRSIHSRLHRRLRIGSMTPEDSAAYLATRLQAAGALGDIFTSDAAALLHEATAGTMRDIDRVADLAMTFAAKAKKNLVERQHVAAAIKADVLPN